METLLDLIATGNTQRRVSQAQIDQSRQAGEHTQALTAGLSLANEETAQDIKDGNIITRAWAGSNGDPQAALKNAVNAGVSGKGNQALQKFIAEHQEGVLKLEGNDLDNHAKANTQAGNAWQALKNAPEERKAEVWATLVKPTMQRLAPGEQWSAQVPNEQIIDAHLGLNGFTDKLLKQSTDRAAIQASEAGTEKTKQETLAARRAMGIQELQQIIDPNTGVPAPEAYAAWRKSHPEIIAPDAAVPGFIANLTRSAVPVKDQPDFDIHQRQADALKNMKPEDWDKQVDATIPNTGDSAALNSRTKALVKSALSLGMPASAIQAAVKDASDQLGRTETAVRTAQNTAPTKISIMQAGADARNAATFGDAGPLTDDDYKRAGAEMAMTGVMPQLGNGGAGIKAKILHYKNEYGRENHLTPRDMALAQASFAGDKKSLTAFQAQRDQIVSFENTASKNLDQFIGLASKIPDTGIPWLNTPIRSLSANIVGSANMAAINAARQVANNEFAKVTSGGGLSAVLSDSARKEVDNYNPQNATLKQTLAVAKIFKQDMANRHVSMDNMLGEIKNRIGSQQTAPATTEHWGRDANGKLVKQ